MKIIWSPLAISRISEITEYISTDNFASAEKWINSIFDAVLRLKISPESGRIVPELGVVEIREIIHDNYRIIYRIKKSSIIILTVRHARQIIPEDEFTQHEEFE